MTDLSELKNNPTPVTCISVPLPAGINFETQPLEACLYIFGQLCIDEPHAKRIVKHLCIIYGIETK